MPFVQEKALRLAALVKFTIAHTLVQQIAKVLQQAS